MHVIITEDFKALNKKYKLKGGKNYTAFCFRRRGNFYVVMRPSRLKSSIVAHETVHLVNMIFEYVCHYPRTYEDEPTAYLHELLFKKVQKTIKKFKTKKP